MADDLTALVAELRAAARVTTGVPGKRQRRAADAITTLREQVAAQKAALDAVRALCNDAGFMCDEYANTENPAGENHDAVHVVDVLAALAPATAENA